METSALLILLSAGTVAVVRHGLCMSAFLGHYKRNLKAQSTPTNWTDAQTYCRENHMDLLTVHTLEEAERVQNIITEESILWIGLRRHQGPTKWSNGDIVHFDNRIEGDGRTPPYCHSMSASGRWVNVDCVQNKSFMCYDEGDGHSPLSYTLIKQKSSWCDAQQYCREHHTDLVSINSSTQNTQVLDVQGDRRVSFWIGLMSADWEWSDGGCSSYRNWDSPNQEGDCVIIIKGSPGMNQYKCDQTATAICYEDEVHLVKQPRTWEGALDHCDREYGGLLRVESPQDQRIVEAALKRSNVSGPVWLGLRQSCLFRFWFWPNGANVEWSNWAGGSQPDKALSHNCGAIATSGPGMFKWSDRDCLSKSYFLCEGEERQAV